LALSLDSEDTASIAYASREINENLAIPAIGRGK
jgi:hypothetical protein